MPVEERQAIVIGTGFGGAVTAHRLVTNGFKVCVLERGRRYQGNDFPSLPNEREVFPDFARWGWSPSLIPPTPAGAAAAQQQAAPSHWSVAQGLWDIRDLGGLVAAHAAGFGGGSLIYANVHLRAPKQVFERGGWPASITRKALDPYYDRVATKLRINPISKSPEKESLPKTRGLARAAKELNRKVFFPPLAIDFGKCEKCGECDTGCRYGAKNTLDLNYLKEVDAKAEVHTLAEVLWIERKDDGTFKVTYFDHGTSKHEFAEARYVFLCAGSICSTELLLRSRNREGGGLEKLSKALGKGFYANADSLAVAFDTDEELKPSFGPTITAAIPYEDEKGRWLMIQDGGYPAALERAVSTVRARALLGRNAYPAAKARSFGDPFREKVPDKRDAPFRAFPDGMYWMMEEGNLDGMVPPQLRTALKGLVEKAHGLGLTELHDIVPSVTLGFRVEAVGNILKYLAWLIGTKKENSRAYQWFERRLLPVAMWVQRLFGAKDEELITIAQGVLVEHYAPTLTNMARVGKWLLDWNDEPARAEHRAVLLGMGRDDAPGRITLDKEGLPKIRLTLSPRAQTYSIQERLMRDIADVWKAELRVNPIWAATRKPITVHHQGGCPMGVNASEGVVNEWGEAYDCKGLFVLDGAALPRAVGVNPSSTIAALAERNIEKFLKDHGVTTVVGEEEDEQIKRWLRLSSGWQLDPPDDPSSPRTLNSKPIGIEFTEVMTGFHAPQSESERGELHLLHENFSEVMAKVHVQTPSSSEALKTSHAAEVHTQKKRFLFAALGLTDQTPGPSLDTEFYEAAYRRGRTALNNLALTMHATIEDVSAFDADDQHLLTIEGTVDFKWLEKQIDFRNVKLKGTARLFVPCTFEPYEGEDRFMLYELGFHEPGTKHPWKVQGFKRMHAGEGTRAWADVTNLCVVVSREDESLSTFGVARLSLETFLYQVLGQMKVTGTEDPGRVSWAVSMFGDVFFGHLTDLYLPTVKKTLEKFVGHPLSRRS